MKGKRGREEGTLEASLHGGTNGANALCGRSVGVWVREGAGKVERGGGWVWIFGDFFKRPWPCIYSFGGLMLVGIVS